MRRRSTLLLALCALIVASGCADGSEAPAASRAAGLLVSYSREGGEFTMFHDRLKIRSDGRASLNGRAFRVRRATLAKLKRQLGAAGFATLQHDYGSGCCSGITEVISYKGRTVTIHGDPGAVPEELKPALKTIGHIAVAHSDKQ
jgi:hypothetical protein